MSNYLVRLEGRNFLINGERGPRKKRFSATRLVEARSPAQAEAVMREMIPEDIDHQQDVLNVDSDPPEILLESVTAISSAAYDAQRRAKAFYWEDEDNEK